MFQVLNPYLLSPIHPGTITLITHRGEKPASEIFQYSLPFLCKAGVKQNVLGVLTHNVSAISVYRKQGFEIVRTFSYFTESIANVFTGQKR
ncbi:MAG: hypothetical protein QM751_14750 [Paludibacteraceae bacterium]